MSGVLCWTQSDPLRGRSKRSWAFDAAVTLGALLFAGFVYLAGYAISRDEPPESLGVAILVIMVAPLPVRRIWPVPTFAFILGVAVATGWWAEHLVLTPPLAIALYTVATRGSRRAALGCAAALVVFVVAWSSRIYPDGRSWFSEAVSLAIAAAGITVLGLYVGTRRTLLLQLRERAIRLEHERDQQVELAASAERARIARELHDIVAHHLTVMVTLADGAAAQSTRSPELAGEAMRTVSATGRQALTDTRRLLGVLREQGDDAARSPLPGLGDLDELIGGVRAAGLPVRYRVEGVLPELDLGAQLALYRMVQESLTNTMKHAGPAVSATVTIEAGRDEVAVDIVDDGAGTSAATGPSGAGRGLPGMRERMAAVGGRVTSGPADGGGWAVRVRLPVTPADVAISVAAP